MNYACADGFIFSVIQTKLSKLNRFDPPTGAFTCKLENVTQTDLQVNLKP